MSQVRATAGGRDDGVLVTWREAPVAVRALLAGVFVNKLGGFLQIFLVLFLTERGFTPIQAGFALGAYGAGSVAGVLVGGAVSDRAGPRFAIVASLAATAGLLVSILYVPDVVLLVAVVTGVGMLSQFYRPASATLLVELTPAHRQVMMFAMSRLALNLGTTVAPLVAAGLVAISYDLLFWTEAAVAIGFALITYLAVPAGRSAGRPAASLSDAEAPAGGGYLAVLRDRRFALYTVAMLVNAAVYMQYVSTLPLAMRDSGLAPIWYSTMVALNGGIVIAFELLMTKVAGRWPVRRVLVVGFILLGTGMACYALPGGVAVFLLGTLIWSLAEIIEGPTMFAYPAQVAPERLRGRYLGAAHGMFGVGSALGPVLGVALWSAVGNLVWVIAGLASVLALAPGLYGIDPRHNRRRPAS